MCERRTELTKHRAWLVFANPVFGDETHPLHQKARLTCDATQTTQLVACTVEATGLTRQPIMQLNQCVNCGIMTKETTMVCACGHLCGCSRECLRMGAEYLQHHCYRAHCFETHAAAVSVGEQGAEAVAPARKRRHSGSTDPKRKMQPRRRLTTALVATIILPVAPTSMLLQLRCCDGREFHASTWLHTEMEQMAARPFER